MTLWNPDPVRSHGNAMARILSVTLALALVSAGNLGTAVRAAGASPDALVETHHYFRNGGELFRLDAADLAECRRLVSGHQGTHSVRLVRARFGDAGIVPPGGAPFVFGDAPRPDEMPLLGRTRSAVLAATGRDVDQAIDWEPVVSWTVTATIDSVTSRFRRGSDQLSMTIPWELLEKGDRAGDDGPAAWLDLNGFVTRLEPSSLTSFSELEGTIGAVAEGFADLPGFVNAAQGFFIVDGAILRDDFHMRPDAPGAGSSCVPGCLSCAGSLLTSTAAYIALVGACGGALVTGGATALACFATFIGVQATHVAMLASCGKCYLCLEQPTCPCAGEPVCDCA